MSDANENILVSPQSAGRYPPATEPIVIPTHTNGFEFMETLSRFNY